MQQIDFAILTAPRSGSHMLATALDSHPLITCLGELQHYDPAFSQCKPMPDIAPGQLVGGIVHAGYWQNFLYSFNRPKHVIVLRRAITERMLSQRIMDETQVTHFYEAKQVCLDFNPMEFDLSNSAYTSIVQEHITLQKILEQTPMHSLTLWYEELSQSKNIEALPLWAEEMLCQYLGMPVHTRTPMQPVTRKPKVIYAGAH